MTKDITYSIETLGSLTGLSQRTIRYYIQVGLVSRPEGQGRGSRYTNQHLGELLNVAKLASQGFSLEAIRRIVTEEPNQGQLRPAQGTIAVRSHIYLAPGVELVISPEESKLSPMEVRLLINETLKAVKDILDAKNNS
ncbi:MAG: helix-turn-helix domain-containing protein [Deltaproteobacteria bacterium]|jgi:DNA-binding transcriptional MerR regulator|nr:helix-turn-helix domain-containing protein [Deltaproteobacteria bacterium]